MAQAYDFALDKIGMEIMSYQVKFRFLNICTRAGNIAQW